MPRRQEMHFCRNCSRELQVHYVFLEVGVSEAIELPVADEAATSGDY